MEWSREQAVHIKTGIVHMILPRYFIPRMKMLRITTVIVSVANACVYIFGSDVCHATLYDNNDGKGRSQMKQDIQQRMSRVSVTVRTDKEWVREMGSVAEHDRKVVRKSKLNNQMFLYAKELYFVSGKALHRCMTGLYKLVDQMHCLEQDKTLRFLPRPSPVRWAE